MIEEGHQGNIHHELNGYQLPGRELRLTHVLDFPAARRID
jgi:hypothetical protein